MKTFLFLSTFSIAAAAVPKATLNSDTDVLKTTGAVILCAMDAKSVSEVQAELNNRLIALASTFSKLKVSAPSTSVDNKGTVRVCVTVEKQ